MTDAFTPQYELESKTFNPFDLSQFRQFLYENNVIVVGVGIVLAKYLEILTDSFFNNLILPILKKDSDKDGKNDFQEYIDKSFVIGGRTFYYGKFVFDLCKFIIILYVMFLLSRLTSDLIN